MAIQVGKVLMAILVVFISFFFRYKVDFLLAAMAVLAFNLIRTKIDVGVARI